MAGSADVPAADLVVSDRMHHVRSQGDREWAEFPETAGARALVLPFEAKANESESTLRLRHRDLKLPWRVLLNGKEVARLPLDEADMITYWSVSPGTLRDGSNELRIDCTGSGSDDVAIGEVTLIDRSAEEVLTEATVDLSVTEEPGGRATPSRITVANESGTLVAVGNVSGPEQAVRPGVVYSRTGAVRLTLAAGRYVIYAGRGFEYSVARTQVDLARGSRVARRLSIRREVDTAGWAAMDTHLHTGTFARHGDAGIGERMLTIAGEGVELPVSAEHNRLVDFDGEARHAGVREHFTPILGSEVTTPSLGHFNVFQIPVDHPAIDHRAPDWGRLGDAITRLTGAPIVVLNHGRDNHGGFRPLGPARHIGIAGEDLAGWSLPANAMEVVNSGAVMSDGLALPRDWMGMLNRGMTITAVGSSDSHDVARYIVGQGRTYVRCDDRDAGRIDLSHAMESVRRGRTMVSYGLLAELDVAGKGPGDSITPKDALDIHIRVQGPGWTRAKRVALYVNGTMVREETINNGAAAGVKWQGTWRLPKPRHDVHLVAIATGPGITAPYWRTAKPYQPTSIAFVPYVLGMSGAVFVDADGNGRFESAYEYARREVSAASDFRDLVTRLGRYDGAVAVQAASLLRLQAPAAFEEKVRSMLRVARPHVASGLTAYLNAWQESQRASRAAR
ncbi:MAG: CehA/McbA family metallohydrolase [Acidobacteriota bacterium]|nr:CehA/McbA family metallohydrolase [Acidobacteriota bacterium]